MKVQRLRWAGIEISAQSSTLVVDDADFAAAASTARVDARLPTVIRRGLARRLHGGLGQMVLLREEAGAGKTAVTARWLAPIEPARQASASTYS